MTSSRSVSMDKQPRLKWIAALLCMTAFFLISYYIDQLQPLDDMISIRIAALRSPGLTGIMKILSHMAGPSALIIGSLLLAIMIRQRQKWLSIFLNLSISVTLNLGLKQMYARPRPAIITALVTESGFSFPSGHSMGSAAFYGFIIYLIAQSDMKPAMKRAVSALIIALIGLIGFSRVYLGVHYLSDVIGGFLVSSVYLVVFTAFVNAYIDHDETLSERIQGVGRQDDLLHSFAHAFDGILYALKAERNLVIHFAMAALVTTLAFTLQCTPQEWYILIILFGLVITSELINTAIETLTNLVSPEYHPLAKLAKDTAAGAVLVMSIAAAVIGIIIFAPKLWVLLQNSLH